jgi:predicted phosphate transport protein (TIGR00153 family)
MPTTIKFGKLFSKSPFKPVKKHMGLATECVAVMPAAMQALFRGDKAALRGIQLSVNDMEADADRILVEMTQRLPEAIYLPFERRDLFDVLEIQQSITSRTQDIINLMADFPLDVPDEMHNPLLRLVERCIAATAGAFEIVRAIENLIDCGFKGPQVEAILLQIQEVINIETEADAAARKATRSLSAHTGDMSPAPVVLLYQLVGWIDDLANYSQKLAIRSQLLLAR